ncbi:MAG: hypothetical protein RL411_275 [Bacteroidota bacterium]|jgi:hypothetical protein
MKRFSLLIDALLLLRFEKDKQVVWADFIRNNQENEFYVGMATALLKNECPKGVISSKNLKLLAMETVGIPNWLLDESKHFVGDMSETIALILSPLQSESDVDIGLNDVLTAMDDLRFRDSNEICDWIVSQWQNLSAREIQVFNKLVTGSFRSPFSPASFSDVEIHFEPIELKLVLLYAERGRVDGRNGFTEFTMGIGSASGWVTFSKVAVQLAELERASIEQWIIENTQEKFGPVHRLPAVQIFTIECRSIIESKRNKSGYRVTDATLISWENGASVEQVTTIDSLRAILPKR